MKRVPKGNAAGGQFAPDKSGMRAPEPLPSTAPLLDDARPSAHSVPGAYSAFRACSSPRTESHMGEITDSPLLPEPGEPVSVVVLRGIPGSGKSTWAKAVQSSYPPGTVARMNNDDLSKSLFGSTNTNFVPNVGGALQEVRSGMLDALLKSDTVRMVIVDNTNLQTKGIRRLEQVAAARNASLTVDDRFLSVPLETCLQRNAQREDPVPEEVLRKMHSQASRLAPWKSHSVQVQPYHNNPSLPPSIIVDIDGTLAHMHPDRSPYDWHKVDMDAPNTAVIDTVRAMRQQGVEVIIMSGRDGSAREKTEKWLTQHVGSDLTLHMREAGDNRPDHVVKYELFSTHVADKYHVKCVFDDRDQVVHLWRRKLRLPTFQVAEGDF